MGWISVDDDMPVAGKSVLIAILLDEEYSVMASWYDDFTGRFDGFSYGDVTHWMPFPAPPELPE